MDIPSIYTKDDSITVKKENGTEVSYFIFNEYEIHLNKIPPNSIQEYHKHTKIEETIVVTEGEICIKWLENNEVHSKKLIKDTVARVKQSIHTITNPTNLEATFIVYRMVPTGEDKRDIIKSDKKIINIEE